MRQFEILDISGDVGIRVFGKDLLELFANAATGMYSLITDLSSIKEDRSVLISLESHSTDGLFVSWLNELIFHFDTYGFIGKRVDVSELICKTEEPGNLHCYRIKASVSGEDFDAVRHQGNLLIKAATYHKLKIVQTEEGWEAEVIFDI